MRLVGLKPTGIERYFDENEIIVSKTDVKGIITYANSVFCRVAGYAEAELIGQAHNIVRHPEMPRCIFKLMWDTIQSGQEMFGYVVNLAKTGDHYWVFAHVTPTLDAKGKIVGYHSNRRVPERRAVESVKELYRMLTAEEHKAADWRTGMVASHELLMDVLHKAGKQYEEWIFSV